MKIYTRKKIKRHMRKKVPWAGWSKQAPSGKARTKMYKKCGKKCFLGTFTPGDKQHPDFPICTKNTCKINSKGLYAAYIRAKEWGKKHKTYRGRARPRISQKKYKKIASRAKHMLKLRGYHVGK